MQPPRPKNQETVARGMEWYEMPKPQSLKKDASIMFDGTVQNVGIPDQPLTCLGASL